MLMLRVSMAPKNQGAKLFNSFLTDLGRAPFNDKPAGDGALKQQTRSPAGLSLNYCSEPNLGKSVSFEPTADLSFLAGVILADGADSDLITN